jgi:general secretion pathway protein G
MILHRNAVNAEKGTGARDRRRALRRAFTLMEILIVVAIIVVLAGIGGYYLMPQLDRAKESAAKAKAMTIDKAVQTYKTNNDTYPTIDALIQPDPKNNNAPYLEDDAILDPWGQKYTLDPAGPRNKGAKPDVYTTSPTGKVIGNFRS